MTSKAQQPVCSPRRQQGTQRAVEDAAGQSLLDFSNLMLERGYDAMKAYSQSKLAQVIFTFGLAEQLRGTRVTVNALHPASLMDTKMVQSTFGYNMSTVEEGTDWHVFYPCLGGSLQSRIE